MKSAIHFEAFSDHARERIAERVVAMPADEAQVEIAAQIRAGLAELSTVTATGEAVAEVALSSGQIVFVVLANGVAITVMTEGMHVETSSGRVQLVRTGMEPGLYRGIPEGRYHSDPCRLPSLSSTLAKTLYGQSPFHAWWLSPRLNPNWEPIYKAHFDVGSAAHTQILGTGKPYVEIPAEILGAGGSISTKAAKEFVAAAREAGTIPLKGDVIGLIETMGGMARKQLDDNGITLDPAMSEAVAIAEIDGCHVRCMVDNAPEDEAVPLYDLKTIEDASLDAVQRAIMNYGYDMQAAHYVDTWKAATGQDRRFVFIFQEKKAPFGMQVVEIGPDTMATARKKIRRCREVWARCVEVRHWPGYPAGVSRIELPNFFIERAIERESREADFKRHYGYDILDQARLWQAPEKGDAA